jgi:hypothetical protein
MQTVYPLLGGLVISDLMTTSFDKETASIDMMNIATTKLQKAYICNIETLLKFDKNHTFHSSPLLHMSRHVRSEETPLHVQVHASDLVS